VVKKNGQYRTLLWFRGGALNDPMTLVREWAQRRRSLTRRARKVSPIHLVVYRSLGNQGGTGRISGASRH